MEEEYICKNCNQSKEDCECDDGGDFVLSAIIGGATNNAVLGGLIGGSLIGGLVGDVMNDGDLF